jgi:hypothetical protein
MFARFRENSHANAKRIATKMTATPAMIEGSNPTAAERCVNDWNFFLNITGVVGDRSPVRRQ